jgi:uncharacterized membrane protein YidH (DUF202 family)
MSKIGLGGTLFTIYSGFVFIALGAFVLIMHLISGNIIANLWSIAAIMLLLYGVTLVIGAYWQWDDIKNGKEYHGPPDDMKLM